MRFMTGFCLAGIYPLGIEAVISWDGPKHAGAALSWLWDADRWGIPATFFCVAQLSGCHGQGNVWQLPCLPWWADALRSGLG